MREQYVLEKETVELSGVRIDKKVFDLFQAMNRKTGIGVSELVNTALKAFASRHTDFLPEHKTN